MCVIYTPPLSPLVPVLNNENLTLKPNNKCEESEERFVTLCVSVKSETVVFEWLFDKHTAFETNTSLHFQVVSRGELLGHRTS